MNDRIYYVYCHIEPVTDELVYIGHGKLERAWTCRSGQGKPNRGGHRRPDHSGWCYELMAAGLTPDDWVSIIKQGLTKKEAGRLEQKLINEHRPRFNYQIGDNFILSIKDRDRAFDLREEGLSYCNIGERLGVSTMTIWRCLNG